MHKDLEDSVVAVYSKSGGQDVFEGSAFFISPKHLLTAKHVIYDTEQNEFKGELCLKLLRDRVKWDVSQNDITFFDENPLWDDVALITLSVNMSTQPYIPVLKIQDGKSGDVVDISGIDKEGLSRAPRNNHTLSTYVQEFGAYKLDHQVLKGYSGGLVGKDDTPIAIVVQRHEEDQSTLVLPH